jgi:hypothetical protein
VAAEGNTWRVWPLGGGGRVAACGGRRYRRRTANTGRWAANTRRLLASLASLCCTGSDSGLRVIPACPRFSFISLAPAADSMTVTLYGLFRDKLPSRVIPDAPGGAFPWVGRSRGRKFRGQRLIISAKRRLSRLITGIPVPKIHRRTGINRDRETGGTGGT